MSFMSYETTLLTTRALSEGKLHRDPDAKVVRPVLVKPKLLFFPPPPTKKGELISLVDEELKADGCFTHPELAMRVASRTSRHTINVIKAECYDRIREGVHQGTIKIVEPGIRSKKVTVYRKV